MKFEVTNSVFAAQLKNAVACAIGGPSEYADAKQISIIAGKNTLTFQANNGFSAIAYTYPNPVQNEGQITVNATDFMGVFSSFKKDEVVTISLNKNNVEVVQNSDDEQVQTVPLSVRDVQMPTVASKFGKTVNVKREVLIKCMEKVTFAIGTERLRPEFHQWILRISPNKIRAACGDGSRFAVYELEGANIVEVENPIHILIHKDHNDVLKKVLESGTSDFVTIKEYANKDDSDTVSNQSCIVFDNTTLVLFGHDPGAKWPNEDKFLTRKSNFRFALDTSNEFDLIIKGVEVTKNEEVRKQSKVHWASFTPDLPKNLLNIVTEHAMTSKRKVKLAEIKVDAGNPVTFTCQSTFLSEVKEHANKGFVQFEMVDEKQPAVVRFHAGATVADAPVCKCDDTKGLKEQYTMFFVAFNKK